MGQKNTRHFEGPHLDEIARGKLTSFSDSRLREGVTPSTVRRDLSALSALFTFCDDTEMFTGNPVPSFMRTMKRRGRLTEAPPRTRYLSEEEEETIVTIAYDWSQAARKPTQAKAVALAIPFAIDKGLRSMEQLRLLWTDIDDDRRALTVRKELSKTGRARTVPLSLRARRILEELTPHAESLFVFHHGDGEPFNHLNHSLQRLAAKAGIFDLHWHDLRRTCGCRLLQKYRLPLHVVSVWLGHASIAMTERAYAFLGAADLRKHLDEGEVRIAMSRHNDGTNPVVLEKMLSEIKLLDGGNS